MLFLIQVTTLCSSACFAAHVARAAAAAGAGLRRCRLAAKSLYTWVNLQVLLRKVRNGSNFGSLAVLFSAVGRSQPWTGAKTIVFRFVVAPGHGTGLAHL